MFFMVLSVFTCLIIPDGVLNFDSEISATNCIDPVSILGSLLRAIILGGGPTLGCSQPVVTDTGGRGLPPSSRVSPAPGTRVPALGLRELGFTA